MKKGLTQDQLTRFVQKVALAYEVVHEQNLRNFQHGVPMLYIAMYLKYGGEYSTFVSESSMNPVFMKRFAHLVWWFYPPSLSDVSVEVAGQILAHFVDSIKEKLDEDLQKELFSKLKLTKE